MTKCFVPENSYYDYCPSTAAAIIFASVFGISTIIHFIQAFIYRKRFCWVIVMAGIWETAGFIFRVFSTKHVSSDAFGTPAQLLIILAPLWINAYVYMMLGRMVWYFVPEKKLGGIRAQRMALVFVLLDILSFIMQAAGAVMTSGSNTNANIIKIGLDIYRGGVGVQELFVLIVLALCIKMYRDLNRLGDTGRTTEWRPLLRVLIAVLVLITIRIIYRLLEYSTGVVTTFTDHEEYFYCLEALPMSVAIYLLNIWHPGAVLIGPDSEFPKKVKKEKKKKEKKQKGEKVGAEINEIELVSPPSFETQVEQANPYAYGVPSDVKMMV